MEETRFDKIFDPEFLQKLYDRFATYMDERQVGDRFSKVISEELLIGNDKVNIVKVFKNLDLNSRDEAIIQFLEANAYAVGVPKLAISGHTFTDNQKLMIAGHSFFMGCFDDDGYPHEVPEEQTDEMIESNTSKDFIETTSSWHVESLVSNYKEQMGIQ